MSEYHILLKNARTNKTLDILETLRKCKAEKCNKLTFEKGEYKLQATFCEQRSLNISNHGLNGPKRVGILVEDMLGFEIDFNGSTIITEEELIPLAIIQSADITIKNLTLDNLKSNMLQMRVEETTKDYIKAKMMTDNTQFQVIGGKIWGTYGKEYLYIMQGSEIEFNYQTGEIEYGTGDSCIGSHSDLTYEYLGDNYYKIRGFKRLPPIGNILVSNTYCRCGCGILVDNSRNVKFDNVRINACYGMGLIAQLSEDVALNKFKVERKGDRYFTCNADATHFVSCKGEIKVENSYFEGQLDDALNVHGIFVRVIDVSEKGEVFIREMHCQATGLKLFDKGDKVNVIDVDTLLPIGTKTVKSIERINDEIWKIIFNDGIDGIEIGNDLENITKTPNLIFKNNTVKNNRARGMLIANKGKTVIENNYFHTAGASILFESDGEFWFESGGTKDVVITKNHFDKCKHGKWGNNVIEFAKRKSVKDNEYYHQKVVIKDNKFTLINDNILAFDNINQVEFTDNVIEQGIGKISVSHCNLLKIKNDNIIQEIKG